MEKQKTKFGLLVKVIFTVAFAAVFVINMITVVQKDASTGKVTLESMKSYAQGGELPPVNINCAAWGHVGNCFVLAYNGYYCRCEYTGTTTDYCDEWNEYYCYPG